MAKREKMAGINATLSDTERSGEDAQACAETTQALPPEQVFFFFKVAEQGQGVLRCQNRF
jgi:hypothetical protein